MAQQSEFQLFSSLRYDPLLSTLTSNTSLWPCPFYMLPFHRDRMLQAAEHFGWSTAASKIRGPSGLETLLNTLTAAMVGKSTPHRVKILLNQDGNITLESGPTPAVSEFNLFPGKGLPSPRGAEFKASPLTGGALLLGDDDAVHGNPVRGTPWDVLLDLESTSSSSFTLYKTTNRDMYTSARERVGIQDMAEQREVLIVSDKNGEIMEGSLTTIYFWRNGKWTTPPVTSGGQIGTTRRWALENGFCVEGVVRMDKLQDGEECWFSNGVRGFTLGKIRLP